MEIKVWIIIICSLVALCHCAPAQDDNAERHKRGCSSPKAKPGEVYYEGCTKFECKKKRKAFVWVQTLDSGVCCIVENKGFPVGSVIFTNSTADNCTISTLTCRIIGHLPSLVYQYQDNQCNNEELLEALEIIKKEVGKMEINSNHTEELLIEHANHTAELLEGHDNHTEELLEALEIIKQEMGRMEMNSNHTEEMFVEHANHTAELLEGNAIHTEDALEKMMMEMEKIKAMIDNVLNKTGSSPVNGGWTQWGTWSACGSNCEHTRSRTCSNPAPSNGGSSCTGEANEKETCQGGDCIVNGGWSSWGVWSSCESNLSGNSNSKKKRNRSCNSPSPLNGGAQCTGDIQDIAICQFVKLQADSAIFSSIIPEFPASNCIDGNTFNLCHTRGQKYEWLALDFGKSVLVTSVTIYNRRSSGERLRDAEVRISDNLPATNPNTESFKGGAKLGFFEGPGNNGEVIEMFSEYPLAGRYVVVMNNSKGKHNAWFNLAEVTCMGYS